ncbi:MAG: phenylalanine--tRNA ligase subunit beta [Phycisphaerae bacterium]|nr:phenylalanine--tRNA ligase subunit beta [Phycisphaerae bacterium]
MKTSVTWLNDYLDPPLDAAAQSEVLTAAGFPWDGEGVSENGEPWQEIETTSNRGDCLCHVGLAREAAVIGGSRLVPPTTSLQTDGDPASEAVTVENRDSEACPLYTARIIREVEVRESPEWLRSRLEAIGLVPRNNLVDATNFVLFELGQPTHVFDLDLLHGGRVEIRRAREGETLLPIGEGAEPIELHPDDLVIADAERPVALAGVKGGADTAVHEGTRSILLEAATFDPVVVRAASRRHRISSDSSYRFERGVHPAEIAHAADRLASMIIEIAGGRLAPGVVADGLPIPGDREVSIRPDRCRSVLGIEIDDDRIEHLLTGLELAPRRDGDRFVCTIPARRLDLEREADLIEEIARTHGLDRLPVAETIHIRAVPPRPTDQALGVIKDLLVGLGYHETVTHTLIGRDAASPFIAEDRMPLEVDDDRAAAEPTLRPSIIPSLLRVGGHNHDLGAASVRLFETGSTFDRVPDGHRETRRIGLLADPPAGTDGRDALETAQSAFGVVRTSVDRIADRLGCSSVEVVPTPAAGFDAAGEILFDGRSVGVIGTIAADVAARTGHEHPVAAAELVLGPDGLEDRLDSWPPDSAAAELAAFPGIERDLTVVVDETMSWRDLESTVRDSTASASSLLDAVDFVTVFRGGRLPGDRKAVTLRLRFRAPDRTLRHEEVDPEVASITAGLESRGGEIRR